MSWLPVRKPMFVRRYKAAKQICVSAELARCLGQAVSIYRDGQRFLLRPAKPGIASAYPLTGRNDNHGTGIRLSCPELFESLGEGRVYVKETREGFEL